MINANNNKKVSEKKIKCRFCHSENYIKKGYRKTENRGKIQKYLCKECNRFFTIDEGFFRMRYSAQTITLSVDMYLSNLSSRKMRNQLKRHFQTKVSHITILDWVRNNQSLESSTPSDIAVPTIQLQDKNRWLELIQRGYNGK